MEVTELAASVCRNSISFVARQRILRNSLSSKNLSLGSRSRLHRDLWRGFRTNEAQKEKRNHPPRSRAIFFGALGYTDSSNLVIG